MPDTLQPDATPTAPRLAVLEQAAAAMLDAAADRGWLTGDELGRLAGALTISHEIRLADLLAGLCRQVEDETGYDGAPAALAHLAREARAGFWALPLARRQQAADFLEALAAEARAVADAYCRVNAEDTAAPPAPPRDAMAVGRAIADGRAPLPHVLTDLVFNAPDPRALTAALRAHAAAAPSPMATVHDYLRVWAEAVATGVAEAEERR